MSLFTHANAPAIKCPPRPTTARGAFGLRDYQTRAVASIGLCLSDNPSTLLVMPTGTGKTVVIAHAIRAHCKKRALVLAHRQELIEQNARTIGAVLGEPCGIEMADKHADLPGLDKPRVIVASKDSLHEKRLARLDPREFGLIVTDECFPSGTLVDGRPIESIETGDEVSCFDHASGLCLRKVTCLFKSRPLSLVRVHLWDKSAVVCTAGHPVWSQSRSRYVPAVELDCDDMVSRLTTYAQANMPRLWNAIRASSAQAAKDVFDGVPVENRVTHGVSNEPEVCIGADEVAESNAARIGAAEGFGNNASDGTSPDRAGRQRNWSDRSRASASRGVGVDDRACSADGCQEDQCGTLAVALQDRRGARTPEDRRRSRWWFTQNAHTSGAGSEEGSVFEAVRVDRVEVLEPGSDGTFGGLCPDGFVYNLEVEQHHNYFANGVLVHNCHHAVAGTYGRVYEHFKGVPHLGVTATPDRLDEEALGQVFASVAMVYEISDAIHDGWLVPVRAHTVFVKELQLASVKTTAGDLNQGELAEQMEAERVLHEVAASITREANGRRAIIFTVSIRQASRLAEILNDYEPDSARFVCGETPKDQRAFDLSEHRAGRYRYCCNVGVLTEGYDDPGCSMIVMARPTKSRALFAQCLGRGTRPLPGTVDGLADAMARRAAIAASGKPGVTVMDFTGNCGRHKLVTPADVLGGAYPDADINAASAMMIDGEMDVVEALEKARAARESIDHEALQTIEELRARRARIVALAKYVLSEEDLFDGAMNIPGRERGWATGKAPTDPQIDTLERAGFARSDVERMSRNECSRIIGKLITRRMAGLCTLKQAKLLERFGYKDAGNMTFEQAGQIITQRLGGRR